MFLAKLAVEAIIAQGRVLSVAEAKEKLQAQGIKLPPRLFEKQSGIFVTIEQNGKLRGCIGTYLPLRESIIAEVIANATAAATSDARFPPLRKEELPSLSYTVYILGKPHLIKDVEELDPKRYGVIVKNAPIYPKKKDAVFDGHTPYKTGLLLPDLPGIDTPQQQILIACEKGGIDPHRERLFIYRFIAKKYR